jgi:hypothetical protein
LLLVNASVSLSLLLFVLRNTEASWGNDTLVERGVEIGKALAASRRLLALSQLKVGGKHSSSFNRQREVCPTAMESSNHVCYRRSADWESQPDAHLGVPVWACRRDTHLLAHVDGER